MNGGSVPDDVAQGCLDLDEAAGADVLLNLWHSLPVFVVQRFRQTIFVDTDPGLVQVWMTTGDIRLASHDIYFTIGETVGTPEARFPDCGLRWHYTPTPVYLPAWPIVPAESAAPYTTVTHWWGGTFEFRGETFSNDKSRHARRRTSSWRSASVSITKNGEGVSSLRAGGFARRGM